MDGDRYATPTAKANQLSPSMQKHPGCRNIWPTPTSTERSGINPNTGRGAGLSTLVKFWPTPTASQWKGTGPPGSKSQLFDNRTRRLKGDSRLFSEGIEGQLHPAWVCWLMQWPLGWDSLEPLPPGSLEDWKQKTIDGSWWLEEPEIPRIARDIPQRAKRLKALGNGMVPLCFAIAYEELSR